MLPLHHYCGDVKLIHIQKILLQISITSKANRVPIYGKLCAKSWIAWYPCERIYPHAFEGRKRTFHIAIGAEETRAKFDLSHPLSLSHSQLEPVDHPAVEPNIINALFISRQTPREFCYIPAVHLVSPISWLIFSLSSITHLWESPLARRIREQG